MLLKLYKIVNRKGSNVVKIKYLFHDAANADFFPGDGEVSSFGTGMSDTSYFGTFTNTSKQTIVGIPLVVAAATTKNASTLSAMNSRIEDKQIPVGAFYFIPSSAFAVWNNLDDNDAFRASLPLAVLEAGRTYQGFYFPLTALPPFGSRAEVGTVDDSNNVTITAADFFYLSAAYFNSKIRTLDGRIEEGKKSINVTGGDNGDYQMDYVSSFNANLSVTFAQLMYQAAGLARTPHLQVALTELTKNDKGGFLVHIKLDTSTPSGKPQFALSYGTDLDNTSRHGADSVGMSGFVSAKGMSFDCATTHRSFDKDIKEIRFQGVAREVAGVDYFDDDAKRIRFYVRI